jgi:Zn-dependent protease with chaperone function
LRLQQAQLATLLALPLMPIGLHGAWFALNQFWSQFLSRVLKVSLAIPQYHFPVPGLFAGLLHWVQSSRSVSDWLFGLAHLLDVVVLAALTFAAAPYWLDWVMQQWHGMKPFSLARLGQTSPEAQRRLQTICQQQKIPIPQLGLLPTTAPIVLTYGSTPPNARIVVSQGLLDQLDDAEIAALYSAEASQINPLNMGVMSWVMGILQVFYLIYWLTAQVGDRVLNWADQQDNRAIEILTTIVAYAIATLSTIAYSSFWCLRWAGLWLTRRRLSYADHAATNATGNPNAQARALLKLTHGLSQAIQTQGQTDFLLEGWELLMPIGYRQALTSGSLLDAMPIAQALEWDCTNPQRQLLTVNNSHALIGDRLAHLMRYAQSWQLEPAVDLSQLPHPKALSWGSGLGAGMPFWGATIGYAIAVLLWAIAWIAYLLDLRQLSWLGSDFKLFYALPLIGFGLGTGLRFNDYFPDLPHTWHRRAPEAPTIDLAAAVQDSRALPNQARPTALTGKLLGREGISNWLGQDLLLQTPSGLIRLHSTSALGILGNWPWITWFGGSRAMDMIGQSVHVAGWLRRGATPWFDLEILRHPSGRVYRGGHQIWAAIVGAIAILLGLLWLGTLEDLVSYIQKRQALKSLIKKP